VLVQPSYLALLGVLLAAALLGFSHERELATPRDLHAVAYSGAASCTRCHADHAESFGRTFHRTMTREARGASVRAPFAGEQPSYFGVPARMDRRPDGTPTMSFGGGDVPQQSYDIVLTVGSRRYQQYIGKRGDELVRLPWAYHLEEQRWFHMNGAFLTADPELDEHAPSIRAADYNRHLTRWNDNCIFCHNVSPSPGLTAGVFHSSVEEYGVACEACHGPGAAHTRANRDPSRRYRLHLSDTADPTIVNPGRLSQERSLDLCGRCHGQRITDEVARFLRQGDPFVPGDDLSLYSAPLWRDTSLNGEVGGFAARFWSDGTPRLTAYEYQGALLSPCTAGGAMTCLSCHDMHAGDPRGQLRAELDRDQLCTQCHSALAGSAARARHSQHGATDASCVDCHMPPIVYGVLTSHPSHRIEVPAPDDNARRERPDACTLCHLERSRSWAIDARRRLWPGDSAPVHAPVVEDSGSFSQAELQLLAADPVTRALTAERFAYGGASTRVNALLLDVMEHDRYPGVRHLAQRSLLHRFPALDDGCYQPEGTLKEREAALQTLRTRIPHDALDPQSIAQQRALADDQAIEIGE
jgi:predicted CXXCH cytochrome family protein